MDALCGQMLSESLRVFMNCSLMGNDSFMYPNYTKKPGQGRLKLPRKRHVNPRDFIPALSRISALSRSVIFSLYVIVDTIALVK